MTNQNKPIRIDTEPSSILPAFIDYDYAKKRPRGGSCRVDFFSYGRLSGVFDDVKTKPFVFVRVNNTIFEEGMFLVDFAVAESDPKKFVEMIKGLGLSKMYLEESEHYPLAELRATLADIEIIPLLFY